ncbi:uncharacterized protein EHS24_003835 [Apiotrichum porosum]|uniref:Major facilitator superfamily (MFS) profile domain-containing protein n=1 Tax=Apiotrichum porosum TaxID=105984 RepID=A0A427XDA4_9TREE|nr:uncharacterized protein EHS24_003835 [Apiotrichum porosum]RSH76900.1 hypothetical protein EHS24_003835 [Apiotrichum porosum]
MAGIEEKTDIHHDDMASIHRAESGKVQRISDNNKHLSPELAAALETCAIRPWSSSSLHLYVSILCALCCAYANGYDGSLMTAINAMPFWQARFGHIGTTGTMVSVVFSMYNVGCFIGGFPAAWITDRWGRRAGMAAGAIIIIIGSILLSTSNHIAQFIVGRLILGFGIASAQLAAPAYVVEVAPPHWKGRCVGIYNCGWYAGAIPAAAITFGCNYINSDASWIIPIVLQCAACIVVLGLVPFIPESPRYLMKHGKEEQALAILAKFHGGGDPNNALVQLEMEEMRAAAALDEANNTEAWWDYRPLFATKSNAWRMFSGNGLAYFATVIFEQIGVTSVTAQLGYNLMYSALAVVGALTGAVLTDRMKRRYVLTFGTAVLSITLAVFVGLTSVIQKAVDKDEPINAAVGKGAIAVYILFGVFCAFVYTPLQATVTVEHLSTSMRAKGLALCNVVSQAMGFINLFAGPIALANIGYYYVMFFIFWDLVEALCWWFFGVEAQGRSLEELDWVYEQPNPIAASKKLG